jgi:hypothetical protein
MSSSKKFTQIFNDVNIVLKAENMRLYANEEELLMKMYERYIIYCRSRDLNPIVKNIEKFSLKFKTYLAKDKDIVSLFFNNYFTDNFMGIFRNFNESLQKPKDQAETTENVATKEKEKTEKSK